MIKTENMYTLLSIDAWRYDGGWIWNAWYKIEEDIHLDADVTPRTLFSFMRRNGWLSYESKGRVAMEDDGHNLVILARSTREPLFAFKPQWEM